MTSLHAPCAGSFIPINDEFQRPLCRKHPNCNNPMCTFFHPANFQMAKCPREPPDAGQTAKSAGMDQSMVNQVRSSPAQKYQETQYMSNPNLATRYKNWGNETSNQAMDQNNFMQDHQPNKNFPQQWNQQQNRCPPSQPQPLMDMKPRFRSQQTPNVQYYAQPDSAMMQNSTMGMVQSPNVQPQYSSSQPLMMQNPSLNMHQTPRFHQHPQHPHQRMMEQSSTATMLQFPNHQQYMKYQIETSPPSHPMDPGSPTSDNSASIKSSNGLINHKKLTVLSANANSLKNKMLSFKFNMEQLKPHVVVIQETKLKRKSQFKIDGYKTFPTVRGDSGGGLLVSCLCSLDPVLIFEGTCECEVLVVQDLTTNK